MIVGVGGEICVLSGEIICGCYSLKVRGILFGIFEID